MRRYTYWGVGGCCSLPVIAMDAKGAFLNSKIEEDAFVRQAPSFEIKDSQGCPFTTKPSKALCGIFQGPNIWNETIDVDLRSEGFCWSIYSTRTTLFYCMGLFGIVKACQV